MKKTNWLVWFSSGGVFPVSAFSYKEAAILASAMRIGQGRDIKIQSIENLDNNEMEISFPCTLFLWEVLEEK